MTTETHQTWDQALVRRLRAGDHRRPVGGYRRPVSALLAALLAIAMVVGLLPGVAHAHYDVPGINDAQLDIPDAEIEQILPQNPPVPVKGKSFSPNDRVFIFECPAGATDLLNKCLTVGVALTDANGEFSTQVELESDFVSPSGDATFCLSGSIGNNNLGVTSVPSKVLCSVAAATYDTFLSQTTSMADHYVCFGAPTGVPCSINRDGSPTTTTTIAPPAPNPWEAGAPMSVAREGLATAVGADGRIYALGGVDADPVLGPSIIPGNLTIVQAPALDSGEVFDPCGTKTWSPITSMPRARTQFAAATGPDGRIYAIGGRDRRQGTPSAAVDAYNPATNTWSTVAPLAVPRSDLAAATGPDGLIYAIGGLVGGNLVEGETGRAVPTVEAYDTATNTWSMVTPLPAVSGDPGAATGPDGRVYAISPDYPFGSGSVDTSLIIPGQVNSYSPGPSGTPGTWRKEVGPVVTQGFELQRMSAVTTGPDGLIYDLGGGGGKPSLRSVLVFDTDADTWIISQDTMTSYREGLGAAAGRDGRIYAIGGIDNRPLSGPQVLASTESQKVAPSLCPAIPPVADFNGDESTDIAVFRPAKGVSYFRGQTPEAISWGTEGDIPVPGDYDGDQQSDVGVFRPSNGVWYLRGQTPDAVGWGADGDIPVPADYDGDHKTDIAVYRPSSGTWYIRQSATNTELVVSYGAPGDVPVPADYDGDRKADIAVFRPANGVWYLQGQSPDAISYGAPGDIPVAADYDGDGDADIAVFRPSNGVWYLRNQTPDAVAHGANGDIPVPADYDGDGIADLTVFRPSNGVWYLESGEAIAWGIAGDIPLPLPHAVRKAYFGG